MLEAVFIADLHLHPTEELTYQRFEKFLAWAEAHTQSLYILGDFFHAWAGDDTIDTWSLKVAKALKSLTNQGIKIFFMPGNRDFLVGKQFLKLAGVKFLPEPAVIQLKEKRALLVHGDKYCIHDKAHQRFRKLTRNNLFTTFFLRIPKAIRQKMVNKVRQHSQHNLNKPAHLMIIEPKAMLKDMLKHQVETVIHGHIHRPGLTTHLLQDQLVNQYVLSDWDDNPHVLCYDQTKGFYFNHVS